jgi:hypothetical protein
MSSRKRAETMLKPHESYARKEPHPTVAEADGSVPFGVGSDVTSVCDLPQPIMSASAPSTAERHGVGSGRRPRAVPTDANSMSREFITIRSLRISALHIDRRLRPWRPTAQEALQTDR